MCRCLTLGKGKTVRLSGPLSFHLGIDKEPPKSVFSHLPTKAMYLIHCLCPYWVGTMAIDQGTLPVEELLRYVSDPSLLKA